MATVGTADFVPGCGKDYILAGGYVTHLDMHLQGHSLADSTSEITITLLRFQTQICSQHTLPMFVLSCHYSDVHGLCIVVCPW